MARKAVSRARCEAVQRRITESFLGRATLAGDDLAHARACQACGAQRDDLRALAAALDSAPLPDLAPEVLAATERRAAGALSGRRPSDDISAPVVLARFATVKKSQPELPARFRRELTRLLASSLLPLSIALLWNAALFFVAGRLLGPILPGAALLALGAAYGVAFTVWLAAIYGSLPILAYRRSLRLSEGTRHV
jgi:hypothetical protein